MALSKGSKAFLASLVVLALLGIAGVFALGWLAGDDDDASAGEQVTVEIPEGTGASAVGDLLAEEGVIDSALAFKIVARFDERGSRIQSGTYELRTGMGTDEILEVLSEAPPPPDAFRVTIPEGRTVEQTLERLAEAENSPFAPGELRDALDDLALPEWVPSDLPDDAEPFEGLLFPDTYEFTVDTAAPDVLGRLVARTDEVLSDVPPPEGLDAYELLVLASLIEREARLVEEQPRIASVIHNRLDEGMRLQVDATVLYALGEHQEQVTYADLEVDSPWNTYLHTGLPPTPISGAGRRAIEAAADPADEDYLYYVVVDPETGEHGFSRTLEEHNELRRQAGASD